MELEQLKLQINKELANMRAAALEFPWENRDAYQWVLSQTYYYVCHSTRLLASAAARFSMNDEKIHHRYLHHAREEGGHQKLAQLDLQRMGLDLNKFEELATTTAFYQTPYAAIQLDGPFAFMGYVFGLEGVSADVGPKVYARALEAHGPTCTQFLKVHVQDEPEHVEKAYDVLKGMSDEQLRVMMKSLKVTAFLYPQILAECARKAGVGSVRKAA